MKGRVETHRIQAPSLVGNPLGDAAERPLIVYYPPGYDTATQHPVAYFLHGFSGSVEGWVNRSAFVRTVPERIDALIDAGTLPPLVGVFIDGWTAIGGSQWINSAATGRYGDYLTDDVVGWVDRHVKSIPRAEGRVLLGKSSGGYGTLATVARRPDVFGHAACHSGDAYFEYGYLPEFPKAAGTFLAAGGVQAWWDGFLKRTHATKMRGDDFPALNVIGMAAAYSPRADRPLGVELPFDLETARILPDVWARWLAQDPVRFVPERLAAFRSLKTVFIDCGTRDEFSLRWGARMVVQHLKASGAPVLHEEFEDGHMGTSYRYDASLKAIAPHLP